MRNRGYPQIHITHNYQNYDLNPGKNLVADLSLIVHLPLYFVPSESATSLHNQNRVWWKKEEKLKWQT